MEMLTLEQINQVKALHLKAGCESFHASNIRYLKNGRTFSATTDQTKPHRLDQLNFFLTTKTVYLQLCWFPS